MSERPIPPADNLGGSPAESNPILIRGNTAQGFTSLQVTLPEDPDERASRLRREESDALFFRWMRMGLFLVVVVVLLGALSVSIYLILDPSSSVDVRNFATTTITTLITSVVTAVLGFALGTVSKGK